MISKSIGGKLSLVIAKAQGQDGDLDKTDVELQWNFDDAGPEELDERDIR